MKNKYLFCKKSSRLIKNMSKISVLSKMALFCIGSHIWRPWFMVNNGDILVYFGRFWSKISLFWIEGLGWVVHFRNTVSELACHPHLRPQTAIRLATSRPSRWPCPIPIFVRCPLHFRISEVSALVANLRWYINSIYSIFK